MKYKQTELELFAVHEDAKQYREIRSRWQRVEPSVWTDHMLAALEQGVKGNKWFNAGQMPSFPMLGCSP